MNARRVLPAVLSVVAGSYAAVFVLCVAARLTYGFELSWLESGMQAMTDRLANHEPIYAAPSPAYVPFLYPPLYYVLAHAIQSDIGPASGFTAMRLVSVAATLATVLTLYLGLGRRRLPARLRLTLAALLLAFYGRFEFWHDTSRVDSLFVLLLFGATALLLEGRGVPSALAAGALGGLAALTKQPAVLLLGAAGAVVSFTPWGRRRTVTVAATAAAVVIGGLAVMGELGDPWLYYYLVTVPAAHPWIPRQLPLGLGFVAGTMPLFILATAAVVRTRRQPDAEGDDERLTSRRWALVFITSTVILLVLRLKQGASLNFFLPLVPLGIMVAAPVLARLAPRRGEALLLAQFLILLYNPLSAIPTARDWQAGFELLGALRAVPGDVFLPQFPGYLLRAGKSPVAHTTAVCDLAELRPDLIQAIDDELNAGRFAAAMPWPALPLDAKDCRSRALRRFSRGAAVLPTGGEFFLRGHASKLGELLRYERTVGDHS